MIWLRLRRPPPLTSWTREWVSSHQYRWGTTVPELVVYHAASIGGVLLYQNSWFNTPSVLVVSYCTRIGGVPLYLYQWFITVLVSVVYHCTCIITICGIPLYCWCSSFYWHLCCTDVINFCTKVPSRHQFYWCTTNTEAYPCVNLLLYKVVYPCTLFLCQLHQRWIGIMAWRL